MGLLLAEQKKNAKLARKMMRRTNLAMHIGSVAIAIEAMEELLKEKGIIGPEELMKRIETLTQKHYAHDEFIPPDPA